MNPSQIFKVENLKYNKMLNTIIFKDEGPFKIKTGKEIQIDELRIIKTLEQIKHNDNFNDIIQDKSTQLKYMKIMTMVYDLIVKFYIKKNH